MLRDGVVGRCLLGSQARLQRHTPWPPSSTAVLGSCFQRALLQGPGKLMSCSIKYSEGRPHSAPTSTSPRASKMRRYWGEEESANSDYLTRRLPCPLQPPVGSSLHCRVVSMFHCFNFFIYLPWLQSKILLGSLKKTPSTGSRHLNLDLQGKYDFLILATVI